MVSKPIAAAALCAIVSSFLFTRLLLPALKKLKAGQPINEYVVEHKKKSGTPTIGGAGFLLASLICVLIANKADMTTIAECCVFFFFAALGFADDFLKIRYSKNEGLTPIEKTAFQIAIALIASLFCVRTERTILYIPFSGGIKIDLGLWFIPFATFVFVATANCVNLTDGLDGLATSSAIPAFFFVGVLCALRNCEKESLFAIVSAAALIGFLPFNANPAKIFMGDTGSLAIGGLLACLTVFSGNALYIPIVGICFVWSGVSVIVQVLHYKRTKKRVFLMAPFHHHLQHKGMSENAISSLYFCVSSAFGLLAVLAA